MRASGWPATRGRWPAFCAALAFAGALATFWMPVAAAEERPETGQVGLQDTTTGIWADWRMSLERSGVRFGVTATNDAMVVVRGGIEQADFYPGLVAPTVELDLEQLFGWEDTLLFAHGLGMYGHDPSDATGAIDTPSNIANAAQTFRVYEAWIERRFLGERLDVRAGIYATDSEFDARVVSSVLMNSSFGTGVDLAQTGLNGPCIYSTGCLGTRVRYWPTPGRYVQLAVLDAVAGDPDDPYGTHVEVGNGEGVLVLGEAGYERGIGEGSFLHAALGIWYYTSRFEDVLQRNAAGGPDRSRARPGVYAFVEGDLFRETPGGPEGLTGFLRLGTADPDVNQVEYFASGGLAYTGLLPGRSEDVAAFGVLVPINGDEYMQARRLAGSPADRAEYAFECTYWMPVLPWLGLQLDAQYFVNPGTDPTVDDALVLGVRSRIVF